MKQYLTTTRTFLREDSGGITILNVYFMIVLCVLAGVAIDMASLAQARTQLQVAADSAAHAAIITRERNDLDAAKGKALEMAKANIPSEMGVTLEAEDILFGTYEKASRTFTVDQDEKDAVYVLTERALADANPVSSFLLKFIGFNNWDVRTASVYETYMPMCFNEGFVAQLIVDVQSGNTFTDGFCVHSNTHVEINNDNTFEEGVIVSMPNKNDAVTPANDKGNVGWDKALRSYAYDIKILGRLKEIKEGLNDPTSDHYRTWLTNNSIIKIMANKNKTEMDASDFTAGRLYHIDCTEPQTPSLTLDGVFTNVGIITDCPIVFRNGVHLIESTVITTNTGTDSWKTPNGLILGGIDDCKEEGESQLLSYGSVSSASDLTIYGSQIIVAGDIDFSASGYGKGAAVVAGGTINTTSGMTMEYCGSNMGKNFHARYFRLAG